MPPAKIQNICGPKLRAFRNEQGLSQPEIAAKCQRAGWDISREGIAKIEGQTRQVRDHELKKLAEILNVEISDLV